MQAARRSRVAAALLAGAAAIALNTAALGAADLVPRATAHSGLLRLLSSAAGVAVPAGALFQPAFHIGVGLAMAVFYAFTVAPVRPDHAVTCDRTRPTAAARNRGAAPGRIEASTLKDPTMSKSFIHTMLVAMTLAIGTATLAHAENPVATGQTSKGTTLVDGKGMTLYTFDKDPDGKSVCNGACAKNWPPLIATDDDRATGGYGVITRSDGSRQWAYKGKPLYTWMNDRKPGDITGDGFLNGAWHVAQP
jgi:predicted lipoprotein with Yx(FWY)xxD motif